MSRKVAQAVFSPLAVPLWLLEATNQVCVTASLLQTQGHSLSKHLRRVSLAGLSQRPTSGSTRM